MMTALQKIQVAINRARRMNASIAPIPVKTLEEVVELVNTTKEAYDNLSNDLVNYQKAIIAQPGWVFCKDRMPKIHDGEYKLCWGLAYFGNGRFRVQLLYYASELSRGKYVTRWKTPWCLCHDEIIAWFPIEKPEPPKVGEENENCQEG